MFILFLHSQALIVQDGPLASLFGVSWSHTYRHTVGLLWTSDQPVAEASTYTRQHNIEKQQTNIHAPSGNRTRDPSNQAAADLRLRPRGHWEFIPYWTQNNCELRWPLQVDMSEGGEDRKTIAQTERERSPFLVLYDVKVRFRPQKYRNGGQLWAVNVFSYTIHAQTDSSPSCSTLALYILFLLLLWRSPSWKLFWVHCTCSCNTGLMAC
jgi:hypothetical protein